MTTSKTVESPAAGRRVERFVSRLAVLVFLVGCRSEPATEKPFGKWEATDIRIVLRTEKGFPYVAETVRCGARGGGWSELARVDDRGYGVWKCSVPKDVAKLEVVVGARIYDGVVDKGTCRIVVEDPWFD